MVTVYISPQTIRAKLAELGLTGLSGAGQFARCPHCNRGLIRFLGIDWYSSCCRLSGSVVDLVGKLKHGGISSTDAFVASMLQSPEDLAKVQHVIKQRSAIQSLWAATKPLNSMSHLQSTQNQITWGSLQYTSHRSYHSTNLDKQIRCLSSVEAELWAKKAPDWIAEQVKDFSTGIVCFAAAGYTFPGAISSIVLFKFDSSGKLHCRAVTGDDNEPGLIVNADAAISGSNLVLMSDPSLFLRAAFWQADQSNMASPLTLMLTDGRKDTGDFGVLRDRSAIYWGSDLTPDVVKNCHDCNCAVTTHGVNGSSLRRRDMLSIKAGDVYTGLSKRSTTVESFLLAKAQQSSPQEAAAVLSTSGLPIAVVQSLASQCGSEVVSALRVVKQEKCSFVQVAVSVGMLEQRGDGWWLTRGKACEQICSHTFRIKDVRESTLSVEVYYAQAWTELEVPIAAFDSNAFEAVRTASRNSQLGYFSFDPAYAKTSANWCARLNPVEDKPIHNQSVGVDVPRREICGSSILIRSYPVSLESVNVIDPNKRQFIHLADNQLPSIESIAEVFKHQPTYKCFSVLAAQLLRYFNGEQPYVVAYGQKLSSLVGSVLGDLGIATGTWPCDLTHVDSVLQLSKYTKELNDKDCGIWSPIKSSMLYWLVGLRPIVYLGHTMTKPIGVKQKQLHRVFAQLLYEAVKANDINPLKSEFQNVNTAWTSLLAKANEFHQTMCKPVAPDVRPINAVDAVAYWLKQGISNGTVIVRRKSRKSVNELLLSGTSVSFRRDLINHILDKHRLPTWQLSRLTLHLQNGPGFISIEENFGSAVITLNDSILKIRQHIESGDSSAAAS